MKLSVSHKLIALSIASLLAFEALGQMSQPCKCPCGGEHRCPRGYSAACWCEGNKCSGDCIGKATNAKNFAAKIASVIEDDTVTVTDLNTYREQYEDLLTRLMKGKKETGVYEIKHEGRTINFAFTKQATDQINAVTRDLKVERFQMSPDKAKPTGAKPIQNEKP